MSIGEIIGYAILALFLGFFAFLIIRTITVRKPKPPESNYVPHDIGDKVVDNLVEAIKFKTVTMIDNNQDGTVFLEYQAFLEKTYPLIMKNSTKYVINKYAVIYAFKGTQAEALLPIAILAHQDVVPAPKEGWDFDPFSGEISEGFIYGRGTQDMKGQMISALDGLELLLEEGKHPSRSIYFCFGHDEERKGIYGANEIVKFLQKEGVRFEYVLDEGGAIIDGKLVGIDNKIALVGTCEKGYADVVLEVENWVAMLPRQLEEQLLGLWAKLYINWKKIK
jgi:carboxypeptidase PM20D1